MSMISEQIKELRRCAALYDLSHNREVEGTKELLGRAADTIEALSEKVRAGNKIEAEKSRAVKIAAQIMSATGTFRCDSFEECRRTIDDNACGKCIEKWLLKKAREELKAGIRR